MEERENRESPRARPAFIRIASGAKVDGLTVTNSTAVGDADFLDNQGELNDAVFNNSRHIVPSRVANTNQGISLAQWGSIFTILGPVVGIILWAFPSSIFLEKNTISIVDVQYELQDSTGSVIHRKSWQDQTVLNADERNIEKMLVSLKLRNPDSSQVFVKLENYTEVFSNPYVVAQTGDFLDELYAISADGDSGFILAIDISPFAKVLPIASPERLKSINFYDSQGKYIDTAQANIATTYGMSIPYKIGIYNKNKKLVDTLEFHIRCRAQMSNLKVTIDDPASSLGFSRSLVFECLPVL